MTDVADSRPTSAPVAAWSTSRVWGTLFVLTLTNVCMSLDRTIPQIIAEPVKNEFGLSDSELGIFIGSAFGLSYGICGMLIGPIIDRSSRKKFIVSILSIWSGMTFLTGFATSYAMLLLTRIGVGGAESGGNPAALSIIGDIFPAGRRSSAVGLYKIGVPAGIFLASSLAAYIASDYGWRSAFLVGGFPGLLLAAIMLFWLREPVRGGCDGNDLGNYQAAPYGEALRFVVFHPVVSPFAIALLLAAFAGAALSAFAAPFLQRNHALSLQEVGFYFAIGSGLAWFSPIVIGLLGDRVVRAGLSRLFFFLSGLVIATNLLAVTMLLGNERPLVIGSFLLWQFLLLGLTTPSMAGLITLTPRTMRGTVIAIVSVGNMCIGFGLGPLVVGMISDMIGGPDSLRSALLIVTSVASVAAAALFAWAAIQLQRRHSAVRDTN